MMISSLIAGGTLNVVRDFYAQLSNFRPINSLAVINALNAAGMDSSKLISSSVTYREWMSHISLEDIRNHVIFTIWKEHQTIVSDIPYYDKTLNNENYHNNYKPNNGVNIHVEEIGNLLETSFYIRQVCILKELIEDEFDNISILDDSEWDMYHVWLLNCINEKGLVYTVYENFKMLEPLITTHQ